jgi:hypothetical protein
MKFLALTLAAVAFLSPAAANAQTSVREISIPSGSETLSARVLDGVGDGSRPVIVLFTGFPAGPNIPRVANELQASGYTPLSCRSTVEQAHRPARSASMGREPTERLLSPG